MTHSPGCEEKEVLKVNTQPTFSSFPPYLFLYYIFPIHAFDGKLLCCRDFFLPFHDPSHGAALLVKVWNGRVAGGEAKELWQTPPVFHGV